MSLKSNNIGEDVEKLKLNKLIEIPQNNNISDIEITRAFNRLKTNIQFLNINNKNSKAIYVTSSYKEEGKSFVSSKLAISYAGIGKKVLIIDSDLKNGKQAKLFNLPNDLGFSNLLSGLDDDGKEIDDNINNFIRETDINNLFIITSGTVPPNPTELISLPKTVKVLKQLSRIFDIIIIDGTSTLLTDEALVLSRIIGSTILVLDYSNTNKNEFIQVKEDIENIGGSIIGVVVNKSKTTERKNLFKSIINNIKNCYKNLIIKIKNLISSRKIKLLDEGKFDDNYNRIDVIFDKKSNLENDLLDNINYKNEKTDNIETKVEDEFATNKSNYDGSNDLKDIIVESSNDNNDDNKTIDSPIINNNIEIKENLNKIESNNNVKSKIFEDKRILNVEEKILNTENELTLENEKNDDNNKIEEDIINDENDDKIIIKPAIVLKAIKNRISGSTKNTSDKTKNINKRINDIKKENNEKIVNIEIQNKEEIIKMTENYADLDDMVIVIVDAEKGKCIAFNKVSYTEKLVRGFDKLDGFFKQHYSLQNKFRKINGFMNMYNISKKQAERIDPLIYVTLVDLEERIWIDERKESNIADIYVGCVTTEYEKNPGESNSQFKERCIDLRCKNLKMMGLEINYKMDFISNSKNISISDRFTMKKYSAILNSKKKKKKITNIEDNSINSQDQNLTENNNVVVFENIDQESENKSNTVITKSEESSVFNKVLEKEKQKKIRSERKKEAEILRKVQKERNEVKRKKIKHEKEKKNEERKKLREENRKIREMERIKQREEARIEEELLEDNLYPKTKNNKDL